PPATASSTWRTRGRGTDWVSGAGAVAAGAEAWAWAWALGASWPFRDRSEGWAGTTSRSRSTDSAPPGSARADAKLPGDTQSFPRRLWIPRPGLAKPLRTLNLVGRHSGKPYKTASGARRILGWAWAGFEVLGWGCVAWGPGW